MDKEELKELKDFEQYMHANKDEADEIHSQWLRDMEGKNASEVIELIKAELRTLDDLCKKDNTEYYSFHKTMMADVVIDVIETHLKPKLQRHRGSVHAATGTALIQCKERHVHTEEFKAGTTQILADKIETDLVNYCGYEPYSSGLLQDFALMIEATAKEAKKTGKSVPTPLIEYNGKKVVYSIDYKDNHFCVELYAGDSDDTQE